MTIQDISRIVCEFYNVDEQSIINGNSSRKFVYYRQIVMYFAKKKTAFSLSEIGSFYGKDHSTVHTAVQKVENYIQIDKKFKEEISQIGRLISNFDQLHELSDKTNNNNELETKIKNLTTQINLILKELASLKENILTLGGETK